MTPCSRGQRPAAFRAISPVLTSRPLPLVALGLSSSSNTGRGVSATGVPRREGPRLPLPAARTRPAVGVVSALPPPPAAAPSPASAPSSGSSMEARDPALETGVEKETRLKESSKGWERRDGGDAMALQPNAARALPLFHNGTPMI